MTKNFIDSRALDQRVTDIKQLLGTNMTDVEIADELAVTVALVKAVRQSMTNETKEQSAGFIRD